MAQSDQVIQNDTGSNVRADINTNLAALFSNSSGSSEPSTKAAHQLWVDESTTPDTLRIRNASNNAWIALGLLEADLGHLAKTGGTLTGNLVLAAGTVGSPSVQIGDADTGLYLHSSNKIGTSTGGVLRTVTSSDGVVIQNGAGLLLNDTGDSNSVKIQAPALTSDVVLTLPSSDGDNGDVLQSDGSGVLSWTAVSGVPTGSVFCVAYTSIPAGYLECNGQAVSRTTYAALFAVLSTTWGNTSGSDFKVPDLRGEFVRGFDNGKGTDSGRSFASTQADQMEEHNHAVSATTSITDPGHSHTVNNWGGNFGASSGAQTFRNDHTGTSTAIVQSASTGISSSTSISQSSRGGTSNSSENRPRNIAMIYIIKT